jgi:uncharacterized Ntn-hydrolase superfamily protein/DNA anti-recombination protein RmuC
MTPAWWIAGGAVVAAAALIWIERARSRRDLAALRASLEAAGPGPAFVLLQAQVEAMREALTRSLDTGQTRLDQRFDVLTRTVDTRIEASRRTLDERLESNTAVVRQVQKSLGEVDASVKSVSEITRDIHALQDILKAPKLRGGLGEFFLGDLLAQIFPPSQYTLQHGFSDGVRVDAALRAGDRIVPVDAKFPLENFRRLVETDGDEARRRERRAFLADVRRHVDAIAAKYIRPEEGTYDFALMYIPAENVYYEAVLRDEELADAKGILPYALSKRVIPVSPNSFYAYLQVILIGLQGLRIESKAREILEHVQSARLEFEKFAETFAVVGRHLSNASGKFEESNRKLDRFSGRLEALGDLHGGEASRALPPGEEEAPRPADSGRTAPLAGVICLAALSTLAVARAAEPATPPPIGAPAHTFSIVARDPKTGDIGVAVQSHWFSVGSNVTWAEAGVGAVATQSFIEPAYGPKGLALMREGVPAPEALRRLLEQDAQSAVRQVAMVDAQGRVAAHTGGSCIPAAGHHVGAGFSVQANLMLDAGVWPAMAKAYESAPGDLADRLIAALRAADAAGGDIRGRQSAALLVVRGTASDRPWADRLFDLRVEDNPRPVEELARLVRLARAYRLMGEGDDFSAAKKFDDAMRSYAAAEAMFPDNDEFVFWHAVTLASLERVDESLPLFRRAFLMNPSWLLLVPRLPATGLLPKTPALLERITAQAPSTGPPASR